MSLSYHDVIVYVDGVPYKPSENYALQLHCTKTAGWQLYFIWGKVERLIGGEFDGKPFCIEVSGMIICGKKPKKVKPPEPIGGWSGVVINKGIGE